MTRLFFQEIYFKLKLLNGFFKKNSIWSEEQNDGTWI